MKTLYIKTNPNYPVHIAHGLINTSTLLEFCQSLKKRLVIISDTTVADLYGESLSTLLNAKLLTFPAGEKYKTRETKQTLEDQLLAAGYGRDTVIIALGGGVVTDMAGFIAATYCRGIPAIYIPTTFLGMVDAAIGGKTGVNTPYGKNLIGSIVQPSAVFIDPAVLSSLSDASFNDGLVETMKHALINDANFFHELENLPSKTDTNRLADIIYRSCTIKAKIVEQDVNENGLRQILNFGHTIGHALEKVFDYRISHGQAVLIGMQLETELSYLQGSLSVEDRDRIQATLSNIHYENKFVLDSNQLASLIESMRLDKKALAGEASFVLLDRIAHVYQAEDRYSHKLNPDLILTVLKSLISE